MKEKNICIITPNSRSYYRAVPLAKEFLDQDQNLVNTTGTLPDGEVESFEVTSQTIKHYKNGQLDGDLEVIDLVTGRVTFMEKYENGILTEIADRTLHGTPVFQPQPLKPNYEGTVIKVNKATQSFYIDGKEVAEQTLAANGATLELLGDIPDGPAKEFDDNGQVRSEAYYKDSQLHGELIRYDDKGRVVSKENYIKGQLQGTAAYYSYYDNDYMQTIASYKNSQLDGKWQSFFANGSLYVEAIYKSGKLQGTRIMRYPNGKIDCEENFENGILHGKRTLYYPQGGVWYQENYKNGRLDGERDCFFANGQKYYSEFYTDGLKEGTRQVYSEQGELVSTEEYHWGAPLHHTERRSLK